MKKLAYKIAEMVDLIFCINNRIILRCWTRTFVYVYTEGQLFYTGYELEQNTVYFLITPFSLSGGSQDTYTTELEAAAAFTPPGGPGTTREKRSFDKFLWAKERKCPTTIDSTETLKRCWDPDDRCLQLDLGAQVLIVATSKLSYSYSGYRRENKRWREW